MTRRKIIIGLLAATGLATALTQVFPPAVPVEPDALRAALTGTWYTYSQGDFGTTHARERLQIYRFPGTSERIGAVAGHDPRRTGDVNLTTYIDRDLDFYDNPPITSRVTGRSLYRLQSMETAFVFRNAGIEIFTGLEGSRKIMIRHLDARKMVWREAGEDIVLIREPVFNDATTAELAEWFAR